MGQTSIQTGGGGDYTTIAGWESGEDGTLTAPAIGQIDDSNNYDEEVTISGFVSTATNYVELRSNPSNRHSGVEGTGHARMVTSKSVTGRVFTVTSSYVRIVGLEIYTQSSGDSDEGVRITGDINGTLIDSCIIHSDRSAGDQDGIYTGNWNAGTASYPTTVRNCVIYDFQRAGINAQQYNGTSTQHWVIEYCLVDNIGVSGETESGISSVSTYAGSTNNWTIYNTAVLNDLSGDCFTIYGSGAHIWAGANNVSDDSSARNKFYAAEIDVTLTDNVSYATRAYTITDETNDDYTSVANDGTGDDMLTAKGGAISGTAVDILGNSRATGGRSGYGNFTSGAFSESLNDYIRAVKITTTEAGTLREIRGRIDYTSGTNNFAAAIYDSSGDLLEASSATTVAGTGAVIIFDGFTQSLADATDYYLAILGPNGGSVCSVDYMDGGVSQGYYRSGSDPDTPPDPVTFTSEATTVDHIIHCVYETGSDWPDIGPFEIQAGGVAFPYHLIKQIRRDMKTLLTM